MLSATKKTLQEFSVINDNIFVAAIRENISFLIIFLLVSQDKNVMLPINNQPST